jgi:Tol biopolymer transport system component
MQGVEHLKEQQPNNIWVINPDGTQLQKITDNGYAVLPTWLQRQHVDVFTGEF